MLSTSSCTPSATKTVMLVCSFVRSFVRSFVLFSLAAATVVSYFGLGQAAGLAAMKGLFKPKETTREDVEKILEEKKRARERKQNEDAKS